MSGLITALTVLVAFGVTALMGLVFIPYLRKLKFGQTILDIGPRWHKSKQGTPTMGGIIFIIGTVVALAAALAVRAFSGQQTSEIGAGLINTRVFGGLAMALGFALIGFIDDYIKVVKKQNLGLTASQKTMLQLLVAAAYLLALSLAGDRLTYIPFIGEVDLGIFYWPIALIAIYGFVNAVNLTDGIDGLAGSVTMIVGICFMLCAGVLGFYKMNLMAAALVGSCAGFLVWNFHPAKVFMGDTGSLFLGGMVCALAFGINRPILLLPAGIIYIVEAMSVVIQVGYYKKTKKRLFKMSPIHHHFELSGWSEIKIVGVFSIITAIGCAAAILVNVADML